MNNLVEEHNIKCCEFEAMKTQLNDLRVELGEAKATVDAQDKIREEAKKNQVKCCSLEEQIVVGTFSLSHIKSAVATFFLGKLICR